MNTHKGVPERIGWLKITIICVVTFFIVAFIAGAYNAWWVSTHCTTMLGILVC